MAEVSAAAVKALRDRTGLPMMDCKKALQEVGGDPEAAVEWLRKAGKKTMEKRAGRETSFGRIAVYTDASAQVGAMIELRCESAPVVNNEEFSGLANDMARQLALGPGAATPEDLLSQPSPGKSGQTLRERLDDLSNRIREVFRLQRVVRINGMCAGYAHHSAAAGAILQFDGGNPEVGKDICMQIVSMHPIVVAREQLDPKVVEKEREILVKAVESEAEAMRQDAAAIRQEAAEKASQDPAAADAPKSPSPEAVAVNLERKADNLLKNRDKVAEGRLREFCFAKYCLLEQPFVKDSKQTVGKLAQAAGMKIGGFVHWQLGKE